MPNQIMYHKLKRNKIFDQRIKNILPPMARPLFFSIYRGAEIYIWQLALGGALLVTSHQNLLFSTIYYKNKYSFNSIPHPLQSEN